MLKNGFFLFVFKIKANEQFSLTSLEMQGFYCLLDFFFIVSINVKVLIEN